MKLLISVATTAVVATLCIRPGRTGTADAATAATAGSTTTPPQTPPGAAAPTTQAEQQITIVGWSTEGIGLPPGAEQGRGGPGGTGVKIRGRVVLTNASMATQGLKSEAAAADSAFELTGANEEKVKDFVGKRVQITGKLKAAAVDAAGRPTAVPPRARRHRASMSRARI